MAELNYPYDFENDTVADADQVMAMFNAIKTLLEDTKLDADNLKASIITSALIANGTITNDDISSTAGISGSKLATPTNASEEGPSTTQLNLSSSFQNVVSLAAPASGSYLLFGMALVNGDNAVVEGRWVRNTTVVSPVFNSYVDGELVPLGIPVPPCFVTSVTTSLGLHLQMRVTSGSAAVIEDHATIQAVRISA